MLVGLDGVESGKLEVFSRSPLSRIGQPDETAGVQAFLLSDEAKYSRSSLAPNMFGRLWELLDKHQDSHASSTYFMTSVAS